MADAWFGVRTAPVHLADIASARCVRRTLRRVNIQAARRMLLVGGAMVVALAIAIPVMGADPSPSAGPPGQSKPDKSANPNKPDKAAKAAKGTRGRRHRPGHRHQGHRRQGSPDLQRDRRRQDVGAVGRPELVLGRQEPAQRLRRQVGLDRGKHARRRDRAGRRDRRRQGAARSRASRRGPADRGSSARRTPAGSPGWPTASPAKATAARTPRANSRKRPQRPRTGASTNRESAPGVVEAKADGEQRASAPQGA